MKVNSVSLARLMASTSPLNITSAPCSHHDRLHPQLHFCNRPLTLRLSTHRRHQSLQQQRPHRGMHSSRPRRPDPFMSRSRDQRVLRRSVPLRQLRRLPRRPRRRIHDGKLSLPGVLGITVQGVHTWQISMPIRGRLERENDLFSQWQGLFLKMGPVEGLE